MSDRAARVPATDVLYDSLASSARLAHKTKTVLQRQITRMAAELDRADTLPARKGELLRAILEIQQVLNQNVESLGRLLHKPIPSAPESASGTPTAEQILAEITLGVGRGKGSAHR
jgi:hypothetical protein